MKLLHIDSSILGANSASRELGAAWVGNWRRQHPQGAVKHLDLVRDPLAHLTGEIFSARATPEAERAGALAQDVAADQSAINDFLATDVIVIGAPMYNFSIPSQLKAWIDRIVVAGKTFRYGANGPEGLAKGKKAVAIISRGGIYSAGPAAALDFQESYLRGVLGFIGITDVTFVRAEKIGYGPEARTAAIEGAKAQISEVVGAELAKAA